MAAIASVFAGPWAMTLVTALAMATGGPLDEAAGDDERLVGDAGRRYYTINLFLTAPLVVLLTVVYLASVRPTAGTPPLVPFVVGGFMVGYFYALIAVTVAHELTHWTNDRAAQVSARILLAFTFNTSFTIYHVHGHHRAVAQWGDAATARRGENVFAFMARTTVAQLRDAWTFEAERLARAGHGVWTWRNRVLTGQLYSAAIIIAAWVIAGGVGLAALFGAAVLGRFIHELMNYVQHYGLVRLDGAPIEPRHAWDCYRMISNALHYNLPRHSEHHMFGSKPFWALPTNPQAPKLPHGYQTMAMLALITPLWRRTMRPCLETWDRTLASDAERQAIRDRGWSNLV